MGADTDVYNACIDIILHQKPVYLYKRSKSVQIKVTVIETTSFYQDISHITINDSILVIISCYVRYLPNQYGRKGKEDHCNICSL